MIAFLLSICSGYGECSQCFHEDGPACYKFGPNPKSLLECLTCRHQQGRHKPFGGSFSVLTAKTGSEAFQFTTHRKSSKIHFPFGITFDKLIFYLLIALYCVSLFHCSYVTVFLFRGQLSHPWILFNLFYAPPRISHFDVPALIFPRGFPWLLHQHNNQVSLGRFGSPNQTDRASNQTDRVSNCGFLSVHVWQRKKSNPKWFCDLCMWTFLPCRQNTVDFLRPGILTKSGNNSHQLSSFLPKHTRRKLQYFCWFVSNALAQAQHMTHQRTSHQHSSTLSSMNTSTNQHCHRHHIYQHINA